MACSVVEDDMEVTVVIGILLVKLFQKSIIYSGNIVRQFDGLASLAAMARPLSVLVDMVC